MLKRNNTHSGAIIKGKLLLIILLFSFSAYAQFYNGAQMSFGKNRLQHKDPLWSYFRFKNFDTYFYKGGKELAIYTAKQANNYIDEISAELNYSHSGRIQFIIFNKLADLKASNIGLMNNQSYNPGGNAFINDNKVLLYFNGNHIEFNQQIRAGIINTYIHQLVYGDNIGSNLKNATLLSFPDWYIKGLIAYLSHGWNTQLDEKLMDGILSGKYYRFNTLNNEDAIIAGQSIWHFVAAKYGKDRLGDILYYSLITKNIEKGFEYVMGMTLKDLSNAWLLHYTLIFEQQLISGELMNGELILQPKKNTHYKAFKISPSGQYIAYATVQMNQIKIWLLDRTTGKQKRILKQGYKLEEKTDNSFPLIEWHPSGRFFSVFLEHKQALWMHHYDVVAKKSSSQQFFQMDKITSFSYSPDGQNIVLSGVQKGVSDIYVFNRLSKTYENITNDPYDDIQPVFSLNGKEILFSSNRTKDSMYLEYNEEEGVEYQNQWDLYLYDYASKGIILNRLTETPEVNETEIQPYDTNLYVYLSDENGIQNRFALKIDSTISNVDTVIHYRKTISSFPITNNKRSIYSHSVSPSAKIQLSGIVKNQRQYIYLEKIPEVEEGNAPILKQTPFRTYQEFLFLTKDTSTTPKKRHTKRKVIVLDENKEKSVDVDNYKFEKDTSKQPNSQNPLVEADSIRKFRLPKQRLYYTSYQINQVVSQLDFGNLNSTYQSFSGGKTPIYLNSSIDALIKVGITDIFEDYRITGAAKIPLSFDNEYVLSIQNLKHRLDKEWIFHRIGMEVEVGDKHIRKHTHEIQYRLKWPFSPVLALKGAAMLRSDRLVYTNLDIKSFDTPNEYTYRAGLKSELVYDNTRAKALNIRYGTRYKIFAEHYLRIDNAKQNLTVIGMDLRNYQKIFRSFIWANRFAGSASFGGDNLIYYLGGVDKNLFPGFNQDIQTNTEQNYVYQTLATNMRGFKQNIRNGDNFFVINSELRLPVFQVFSNYPIKNDFLENLQIIGFGDIGTAWTGWNPYAKDNALFRQTITEGPLQIELENLREPIVFGYGFGLRSRLFGYFIRLDYAKGIEDGITQKGRIYLSFSLDF